MAFVGVEVEVSINIACVGDKVGLVVCILVGIVVGLPVGNGAVTPVITKLVVSENIKFPPFFTSLSPTVKMWLLSNLLE